MRTPQPGHASQVHEIARLQAARFHPLKCRPRSPQSGHRSLKKTSPNPLNHLQPIFRKLHPPAFYSLSVKAVLHMNALPLKGENYDCTIEKGRPRGRLAFQPRASSRRRVFRNPHSSRKILFRDLPRKEGFLMRSTPYSYRRTKRPLQPPAAPAGKIPLNKRLAVAFQRPFRTQCAAESPQSEKTSVPTEKRTPRLVRAAGKKRKRSLSIRPFANQARPSTAAGLPSSPRIYSILNQEALYTLKSSNLMAASIGPSRKEPRPATTTARQMILNVNQPGQSEAEIAVAVLNPQ